jgi:acyl carrier protein
MPSGTYARIQALLVDILGCQSSEVLLTSNLIDDLGCDSIDLAELQMYIEEEFGFTASPAPIAATVQNVVDYVTPRATR